MKILPFFFLFIAASLFLFSCQKTERGEADKNKLTDAKNWFSTNVLTVQNPASRMRKLSEKLDWSQANAKMDYVIVPLIEELKLEAGYFMKRFFIFYKPSGGQMQMEIVELLTKDQPAADPVQMVSMLFERKTASTQLPVQIQDVQAFFYDKQYHTLSAYKINKGQWQPLLAKAVNKPGDEQLATEKDGGSGECRE